MNKYCRSFIIKLQDLRMRKQKVLEAFPSGMRIVACVIQTARPAMLSETHIQISLHLAFCKKLYKYGKLTGNVTQSYYAISDAVN